MQVEPLQHQSQQEEIQQQQQEIDLSDKEPTNYSSGEESEAAAAAESESESEAAAAVSETTGESERLYQNDDNDDIIRPNLRLLLKNKKKTRDISSTTKDPLLSSYDFDSEIRKIRSAAELKRAQKEKQNAFYRKEGSLLRDDMVSRESVRNKLKLNHEDNDYDTMSKLYDSSVTPRKCFFTPEHYSDSLPKSTLDLNLSKMINSSSSIDRTEEGKNEMKKQITKLRNRNRNGSGMFDRDFERLGLCTSMSTDYDYMKQVNSKEDSPYLSSGSISSKKSVFVDEDHHDHRVNVETSSISEGDQNNNETAIAAYSSSIYQDIDNIHNIDNLSAQQERYLKQEKKKDQYHSVPDALSDRDMFICNSICSGIGSGSVANGNITGVIVNELTGKTERLIISYMMRQYLLSMLPKIFDEALKQHHIDPTSYNDPVMNEELKHIVKRYNLYPKGINKRDYDPKKDMRVMRKYFCSMLTNSSSSSSDSAHSDNNNSRNGLRNTFCKILVRYYDEKIQDEKMKQMTPKAWSRVFKTLNPIQLQIFISKLYAKYKQPVFKVPEPLCFTRDADDRKVTTNAKNGGISRRLDKFLLHQSFVRHYFTPSCPVLGLLAWHSVGVGKTGLATGTISYAWEGSGYNIVWVTKEKLLPGVSDALFGEVLCGNHGGVYHKKVREDLRKFEIEREEFINKRRKETGDPDYILTSEEQNALRKGSTYPIVKYCRDSKDTPLRKDVLESLYDAYLGEWAGYSSAKKNSSDDAILNDYKTLNSTAGSSKTFYGAHAEDGATIKEHRVVPYELMGNTLDGHAEVFGCKECGNKKYYVSNRIRYWGMADDVFGKSKKESDLFRKTLIVIDEAHNLYNTEYLTAKIAEQILILEQLIWHSYHTSRSKGESCRVLLLTATPASSDDGIIVLMKLLNLIMPPNTDKVDAAKVNYLDDVGSWGYRGYFHDVPSNILKATETEKLAVRIKYSFLLKAESTRTPEEQHAYEQIMQHTKGLISFFDGSNNLNYFPLKVYTKPIAVPLGKHQTEALFTMLHPKPLRLNLDWSANDNGVYPLPPQYESNPFNIIYKWDLSGGFQQPQPQTPQQKSVSSAKHSPSEDEKKRFFDSLIYDQRPHSLSVNSGDEQQQNNKNDTRYPYVRPLEYALVRQYKILKYREKMRLLEDVAISFESTKHAKAAMTAAELLRQQTEEAPSNSKKPAAAASKRRRNSSSSSVGRKNSNSKISDGAAAASALLSKAIAESNKYDVGLKDYEIDVKSPSFDKNRVRIAYNKTASIYFNINQCIFSSKNKDYAETVECLKRNACDMPKYEAIVRLIEQQDKMDARRYGFTFKHVVYTDLGKGSLGAGVPLLASKFISEGYCSKRFINVKLKSGKMDLGIEEGLPTNLEPYASDPLLRESILSEKKTILCLSSEVLTGSFFFNDETIRNAASGGRGAASYRTRWHYDESSSSLGAATSGEDALLRRECPNEVKGEVKDPSKECNSRLTSSPSECCIRFEPKQIEEKKESMQKSVENYFNASDNMLGEKARILLIDSGFKEGISFADVRHIWIMEPPPTKGALEQIVGRVTRYCRMNPKLYNMKHVDGSGFDETWRVMIHTLYSVVPFTGEPVNDFRFKEPSSVQDLTSSFAVMMKHNAVDRILNKGAHDPIILNGSKIPDAIGAICKDLNIPG